MAITDTTTALAADPVFEAIETHASAIMAGIIPADQPDPIFGLITAHQTAQREYEAIFHGPTEPPEELVQAAMGAAFSAHAAVLSTPPTTMAGVVAILAYAGSVLFDDGDGGESVFGYVLHDCTHTESAEAACNFLPMISDTIARLSVPQSS